jgi:hypothetical protein
MLDTLDETVKQSGDGRRKERRSGKPSNYAGPERRRKSRRNGIDRRSGGDRRAGADRRQSIRRTQDQEAFQKRVEDGNLTLEEIEFVRAIDRYKRKFDRPFPTWSEVLAILKELGYTKDSLG